jgi:hypothetical protein
VATPLAISFLPEVAGETIIQRYERSRQNCYALVAQCVQPSSQGTYEKGWKRWVNFCVWFQVDPYLRTVPSAWRLAQEEIVVDFKEMTVVSFIHKLCIDEKLCPGSVNVYLSAVRHVFRVSNLELTFLESRWVSSARTAVTLLYRVEHPISGKIGLPFTCDMVMHAHTKTFNTETPVDQCIVTAMKAAVCCLMRQGEYIPGSPVVKHWLRSNDVMFTFRNENIKQYAYNVTSELSNLQSVIITITGAKNDIEGEGHRMEFPTVHVDATHAFDLASDLFKWAVRAKPSQGHAFFSYQSRWTLSYDTMSRAIKKVAREMGLDPDRYRTHSLRIGGASMMAAAGRPDYEIQKQGRWKSLAFLEYIRLGRATFKSALDAICNPTLLTIEDVGRMHAGA